jgi:phosphonate degradation associated HDIG domain protein
MKPTIDNIIELLNTKGQEQYGGEEVTQLQHALQCATLAQENQATPELIIACLLHDLGHLLHSIGEDFTARGIDDRHEYLGSTWLRSLFSDAVTEPIRLHVEAKRYLCAVEPDYFINLSLNSQDSLRLQGGIFSETEAEVFLTKPYAQDAVKLRLWDEQAKVKDLVTPSLDTFIPIIYDIKN